MICQIKDLVLLEIWPHWTFGWAGDLAELGWARLKNRLGWAGQSWTVQMNWLGWRFGLVGNLDGLKIWLGWVGLSWAAQMIWLE